MAGPVPYFSLVRRGACGAQCSLEVGDAGFAGSAWCKESARLSQLGRASQRASAMELGEVIRRLPSRQARRVHFSPRDDVWSDADVGCQREMAAVLRALFAAGHTCQVTTRTGLRGGAELVRLARNVGARLHLRVGLMAVDRATAMRWEPGLAAPHERLSLMAALVDAGAVVEAEVGPLVPFVNDDVSELRRVLRAIARCGVQRVVPRWLQDGPGMRAQLAAHLGRGRARQILGYFSASGGGAERVFSDAARRVRLRRLNEVAAGFGLSVGTCGCVAHGAAAPCFTAVPSHRTEQLDLFSRSA